MAISWSCANITKKVDPLVIDEITTVGYHVDDDLPINSTNN